MTTIRCPWDLCACTHDGCAAGWIDTDERTVPCPMCRPEVAAHLSAAHDVKLARAALPTLKRLRGSAW